MNGANGGLLRQLAANPEPINQAMQMGFVIGAEWAVVLMMAAWLALMTWLIVRTPKQRKGYRQQPMTEEEIQEWYDEMKKEVM